MRVQIVQRNCEVPDVVQTRARKQMERLSRFDSRLSSAEVIFETQKHMKRTEVIMSVDGGKPVVAHGEGEDFTKALDHVTERLSKIVRRRHAQLKDHQGPKLTDLEVPSDLLAEDDFDEDADFVNEE